MSIAMISVTILEFKSNSYKFTSLLTEINTPPPLVCLSFLNVWYPLSPRLVVEMELFSQVSVIQINNGFE